MRRSVDQAKIRQFMERLARACRSPGRVYFTGGATMLLMGLRQQTIDIDIKLDPEPKGAFEAIAVLKNELDVNVELAAPDQFVPVPQDWKDHSSHVATIGDLSFCNYDLRAQALAKIQRGHAKDLQDVALLVVSGNLSPQALTEAFSQIRGEMIRYPAVDSGQFEQRLREFLARLGDDSKS